MPEALRLFVAIELPPNVIEALAELQQRLSALDRQRTVRWSAISGIHLTLKFLGDTPAEQLPVVEAALAQAAINHKAFSLSILGVGGFPDLRAPRIIWAGCGGSVEAIQSLRDAIERTIAPLGYPTEERPFSPHLTLGRARQEAQRRDLAALGEQIDKIAKTNKNALAHFPVNGISLMQSTLKPAGAVYMQRAHANLNG